MASAGGKPGGRRKATKAAGKAPRRAKAKPGSESASSAETGTKRTRTREPRKPSSPPDWGPLFLLALEHHRSVTDACKAVGKGRTTAYQRREDDGPFRTRWDEIVAGQIGDLEDSSLKRATFGSARPLLYKGKLVTDEDGEIVEWRQFPEALAQFLLRCRAGYDDRGGPESISAGEFARRTAEALGAIETVTCPEDEPDLESVPEA